jgi:hypothetical protein
MTKYILSSVRGGGYYVVLETIKYTALNVTKFRNLQNCLTTPRKKIGGEGFRQIYSCHKVLFQVTFKTKRFCIAFYESYLSMVRIFCTFLVWIALSTYLQEYLEQYPIFNVYCEKQILKGISYYIVVS